MTPMQIIDSINVELIDIMGQFVPLFQNQKGDCEHAVTTKSGRHYTVANVLTVNETDWVISELCSRLMHRCPECRTPCGDQWIQIRHNADIVRLNSFLIHYFKNHPDKIPEESIPKTKIVLVDD